MTGAALRGVRGAASAAVAAFAASAAAFAVPDRPRDLGWESLAPSLLPPGSFLRGLDAAGAHVPRDCALDAYEQYLASWRAATDRIAPRIPVRDASPWDPAARLLIPPRAEQEAGWRAADSRSAEMDRLERELFAAAVRCAPEGERGAVAAAHTSRAVRRELDSRRGLPGSSALELLDLSDVLLEALRGRPDALACARAAIAPLAQKRLAAARTARAAAVEGERRRLDACEDAGLGAMTVAEYFALPEGADDRAAADPGSDPRSKERVLRTLSRASRAGFHASFAAAQALDRVQWQSCRAAWDAVPPDARWDLFRRLHGAIRLTGVADGALAESGIVPAMLRPGRSEACADCLRRAAARWREEFPPVAMATFDRWFLRDLEPPQDFERSWEPVHRRQQALQAEIGELGARLLAPCLGECPAATPGEDGPEPDLVDSDPGLAAGIPEAAELLSAPDEVDAGSGDDPFDPNGGRGHDAQPTVAGHATDDEWLLRALHGFGVPESSDPVVVALVAEHRARWRDAVQRAQEGLEEACDAAGWDADGTCTACERAMGAVLSEARAADEALVDAVSAALGDALDPADAALLRSVRRLGDARIGVETVLSEGAPFGALEVNPAEVLVACGLPAEARHAAAAVIAAREPALLAARDAARLARLRVSVADRTTSDGVEGTGQEAGTEFMRRSRRVRELRRDAWRAVAAVRAAAASALEECCSRADAAGAAALRAVADRRGHPDAFRPEAAIRTLALALCDALPPDDAASRAAIAAAADRTAALAAASRAERIRRTERMLAADPGALESAEATFAAIGSFECEASAILGIAAERLRIAAPPGLLAQSRAWRQYCARFELDPSVPDIDSAP